MLNADGTYKWYAPDNVKVSQLNNVIINSLPITSKTLNLNVDGKKLTGSSPKVERGTTVQLCASCNTNGADVTFSILKTGETTPITLTEPTYGKQEVYKRLLLRYDRRIRPSISPPPRTAIRCRAPKGS